MNMEKRKEIVCLILIVVPVLGIIVLSWVLPTFSFLQIGGYIVCGLVFFLAIYSVYEYRLMEKEKLEKKVRDAERAVTRLNSDLLDMKNIYGNNDFLEDSEKLTDLGLTLFIYLKNFQSKQQERGVHK